MKEQLQKQLLVTTFCMVFFTHSQAEGIMQTYPAYYQDIEKIQLKDVMTRYFGVNQTGLLSYGLEDAAKAGGHVCPAITGAFLMTREGLKALAKDYHDNPSDGISSYDANSGLLYRGGIKIIMSGKANSGGGNNAMTNVMSLITGAKGADGFKGGPDFPFANRQNLLSFDEALAFDPKTGIEAILTSMTATYEKKDADGNWQPATYEACKGTWRQCHEKTQCDRSVKVIYRFKDPAIIGKDPKAPWPDKIKHILDNSDKAITVKRVDNPAAICR